MAEKENKLECAECGDSRVGLQMAYKLWVKDRFVDALGIDDIMEEVFRMRLKDRNRITEELMSRFLQNNEADGTLDREYRTALMDEYERRQTPYL
jgi:hypothetical protein